MDLLATDACTLPTAERPLRLSELDLLFTTAVRALAARAEELSA